MPESAAVARPQLSAMPDPGTIPVITAEYDEADLAAASPEAQGAFMMWARRLEEVSSLAREGRARKEWAALDLAAYASYQEYEAGCRKVGKGAALRQARKAKSDGCYAKFFDQRSFIGDLVALEGSAQQRQGEPMPAHYLKSVEERGGFAPRATEPGTPEESIAWTRLYGLFRPAPGHRQGDVVVDEQLLAYIRLRRVANFAFYATILGHAEFLKRGVMYLLQLELVRYVLDHRERHREGRPDADPSMAGLRYLLYSRYFHQTEGMTQWKRKMGFEPRFLELAYPREPPAVRPPAEPATVASKAVKGRGPAAWSDAVIGLDESGVALRTRDGDIELPTGPGEFDGEVEVVFDEAVRAFFTKLCIYTTLGGARVVSAATRLEPPVGLTSIGRRSQTIGAFSSGAFDGLDEVGRYCTITEGLSCEDAGLPTDWLSTSRLVYDFNELGSAWTPTAIGEEQLAPQPATRVGNDVFIGGGVCIQRGVTIGDGAIVEPGAVITDDVPPYAVVAGNPARIVRFRFEDGVIQRIQRLRWWRFSSTDFGQVELDDPERALDGLEARLGEGTITAYATRWVPLGWAAEVIEQLRG